MAYPGDRHYDPNRPSWLPYWVDSPTESQAKYAWLFSGGTVTAQQVVNPSASYPAPGAPPAVGTPADIVTSPASGVAAEQTITDVLAQQAREWQAQNQEFYDAVAAQNAPDNSTLYVVAAAAAVVLIFIARR